MHYSILRGAAAATLLLLATGSAALAAEPDGWPFEVRIVPTLLGFIPNGAQHNPTFSGGTRIASLFCHSSADATRANCDIQINIRIDSFTAVPTYTNNTMYIGGFPKTDASPSEPQIQSSWAGNFAGLLTSVPAQIGMDTTANDIHTTGTDSLWAVTASFSDYDRPVNCTWGPATALNYCNLGGADSQFSTPHIRIMGRIQITTSRTLFDAWLVAGLASGAIVPVSAIPAAFVTAGAHPKPK
jgi:hypothetical protein